MDNTETFESVLLRRADGVATVTLNAPERRNAIDAVMARALIEVCEVVDADDSIGAVIVQGAGGYFCSGGDRAMLAAAGKAPLDPQTFDLMGDVYGSFHRFGQLRAPTIAAIRGGAVGAGLNLALVTDLRIVAEDAVLLGGFMRIGLQAGGGNGHLLTAAAGPEAASAMTLFGEKITGARAAQLGFAWEALADAEVEGRAAELASVPAADPELARSSARVLRLQQGTRGSAWDVALGFERTSQMWSMYRKELQG